MSTGATTGFSASQKKMALFYVIAIVLGVLNGYVGTDLTVQGGDLIANIFVRLFKFIAIPVIAVSIIATLGRTTRAQDSANIFRHTIFYTLLTTILAASLAAALFFMFAPANVTTASAVAPEGIVQHSYMEYLLSAIPNNVIAPFLSGNVLAVLLIAAAFGLALSHLPDESAGKSTVLNFFDGLQATLFKLINWIILFLAIGIFGFVSQLMSEINAGVNVGGLGSYFATVLTANFVQMLIILPLMLLLRGLNPIKVAKAMLPALTLAFFSKSSAATLPVTMQSAENNLKVSPKVARFVLPICTTINMNGCAAFILVTVIYLMQNAGLDITFGTVLAWILISTLAAVGNAGVPMGCFFLSASLLASMNVPIGLMGVILPFYAVIDMIETTLNVWSDSCVAAMVDHDINGKKPE